MCRKAHVLVSMTGNLTFGTVHVSAIGPACREMSHGYEPVLITSKASYTDALL